MTIKDILERLINDFDFYNKSILVGNINSVISDLEYLINIFDTLLKLDYSLEDVYNYLDDMIISDSKIEIPSNSVLSESVQIMTIHKSKGLEYPICY